MIEQEKEIVSACKLILDAERLLGSHEYRPKVDLLVVEALSDPGEVTKLLLERGWDYRSALIVGRGECTGVVFGMVGGTSFKDAKFPESTKFGKYFNLPMIVASLPKQVVDDE